MKKEKFLLIHGAWHGAWCYYKLKSELEKLRCEVYTVDLPSLGKDRTSPATVKLQDHINAVLNVLDSIDGEVIVVGHSYGGVVLSQVCEARPNKIKRAIYLTAFMLQSGQTLFDLAGADIESEVTKNIIPPANGILEVKKDAWVKAFYEDCDNEDINLAYELIVPQPFETFVTPVQLGANYNSVKKTYISCLDDQAITVAAQKTMYSKFPNTQVIKMRSSHSPFFSHPKKLAVILRSI